MRINTYRLRHKQIKSDVSYVSISEIQSSAKRWFPGLVNFVSAIPYHFCLAYPAAFTQPGNHLLAYPCISDALCHGSQTAIYFCTPSVLFAHFRPPHSLSSVPLSSPLIPNGTSLIHKFLAFLTAHACVSCVSFFPLLPSSPFPCFPFNLYEHELKRIKDGYFHN